MQIEYVLGKATWIAKEQSINKISIVMIVGKYKKIITVTITLKVATHFHRNSHAD